MQETNDNATYGGLHQLVSQLSQSGTTMRFLFDQTFEKKKKKKKKKNQKKKKKKKKKTV
jgi:hypothetical protein